MWGAGLRLPEPQRWKAAVFLIQIRHALSLILVRTPFLLLQISRLQISFGKSSFGKSSFKFNSRLRVDRFLGLMAGLSKENENYKRFFISQTVPSFMIAMRHSFLFPPLLLGSLTLPCLARGVQNSQPPGIEGINDPNMTGKLIDYWADYACFSLSDNSEPNVKEQCKEACFPGGITSDVPPGEIVQSSQTCWLNGPESDYRTGAPLTEQQKNENPRKGEHYPDKCILPWLMVVSVKTITTGYCICDDPIIKFLGDFFIRSIIEMGKILEKLIDRVCCNTWSWQGYYRWNETGTGVKTAKMFRYAYDAQDAAMEWASLFVDQGFGLASAAGCKTPFSFSKADLAKRFLDFAGAPDELVPGINYDEMPCPKGKKASKKCKEKNGENDNNNAPSRTRDNNQPTKTSQRPSTTTTDAGPTAKADCAAIGRNDMVALLEITPDVEEGLVGKRAVGTTLQNRRLEARTFRPKKGDACVGSRKTTVESKKYPSAGENVMKNALAYGFNIIDDCSDYGWGEQKAIGTSDYDTEHVLEWSMVRSLEQYSWLTSANLISILQVQNFFSTMNDHADFKAGFENPDPDNKEEPKDPAHPEGEKVKKKVDFCKYWGVSQFRGATTRLGHLLIMSNPDPTAPAPVPGKAPVQQTPLQWFAEAYPFIDGSGANARKAHVQELILLQKRINQHPKNNMFSIKPDQQIYDRNDMDDLIKRKSTKKRSKGAKKGQLTFGEPHEQPRTAIQRMRAVVGAYLYMKEKKVDEIFVAQVDRIGAQLEYIENALAKNPKTVEREGEMDGQGQIETRIVTFDKWVPQKLKEKWFAYMDNVYANANKKGQDFMKDNLKRLNDEYNDKKLIKQADVDREKNKERQNELKLEKKLREDMKDYIPKLEAQWAKAKNWPKPKRGGHLSEWGIELKVRIERASFLSLNGREPTTNSEAMVGSKVGTWRELRTNHVDLNTTYLKGLRIGPDPDPTLAPTLPCPLLLPLFPKSSKVKSEKSINFWRIEEDRSCGD
ncbi:uncharacterized protein BDR25DRAFT_362485 [Lindgomyces ingoldianus]|uniref:Uncharacterized protein n=1 Tax=Lindgomyces ingoldianus TaxID=673940 RepID=A0ACB6Q9V1_9PLEO|nr:uncharacterized protein BDR25DRAFT_362485 [Lindgomyces ingoldianus]KAF2463814.1 hypothetical protein BDR25DRAFT_362485 [Lindgomyces ingoldianus]